VRFFELDDANLKLGFGGIGGLLRYKVDFTVLDNDDIPEDDDEEESYF
jgi:hypothetical protein